MGLGRRLLAELLGSAFLAAVVIGSGIAAQRLSREFPKPLTGDQVQAADVVSSPGCGDEPAAD